ncbi:MAG: chalcone isomerase family protein [Burkholderiaceae bacterium]|nr:chalcone isomerase family protein [Burkholderiaceae bacterium]MDZ4145813.1 chalcone isomerase family protein [Burkholderiales bacterium]
MRASFHASATARALALAVAMVLAVSAPAAASPGHPEIRSALPDATLSGQARLRVWGFEVYDAALWVAPGFQASDYTRHGFALTLQYLRDLDSSAIARRSIDEMRRVGSFDEAQATRWLAQLQTLIPDVKKGDRITGVSLPGGQVSFLLNGQATGTLRDPAFARLFFGIWLSPQTSEPRLRASLLTQATP